MVAPPRNPPSPFRVEAASTPGALAALEAFSWPGNVRQLQTVLARASDLAMGGSISRRQLELESRTAEREPSVPAGREGMLRDVARQAIVRALRESHGNRIPAAQALGVHRSTLRRKMREFGIDPSPDA